MKVFLRTVILLVFVFLLTSCAPKTVIPEEVLQLPEYTSTYTAYNLWAQKQSGDEKAPAVIDEFNTQKGELIPFGTEIEFLESNAENIVFKRKSDDKVFVLKYEAGKSVRNIEDVIRSVFTTKTPAELASGIRSTDLAKLKRGFVEKGMRRSEVFLGFGLPPPLRTPALNVDTWTYFVDYGVTKRVVFFGDKVLEIIQLD
ncbi:MAG: hypothetical protein IKA79_07740 [Lentisphaeria bacterium]|nr:hypothetical protein [Lentisphaeria bacterium]